MLKFLLILVLVVYTFYKVASFLFSLFFGSTNPHQTNSSNRGKVNINGFPKSRKKKNYPGGEYVDYEEVK